MITIGGNRPAGWIYVAWHPLRSGYTKIGYSKWHPILPCFRYPHGIKRLHRIENNLIAFGFGPLEKWASDYHEDAENIERAIHRELRLVRRADVGTSEEIFDIDSDEAKSIVRRYTNA